jgi:hypothetical protein
MAEELGQALNFAKAENFRQSKIDGSRVGLYAQYPGSLVQKFVVEHKICALHVYRIAAKEKGCPKAALI